MKKKIMLLGAGNGQLPFLKICKAKGYEVIVVSVEGDYPCFKLADKCYYIDTRNKEKILEIAQNEKIDAILTDQTDVSVPSVAYVAEKMGLRGIGYETSLKFTNKYEMRKAAKEAGVGCPEFCKVTSVDEAIEFAGKIGFPLMMKPTDSSGSRGVYKINNIQELKENFVLSKKCSSTDTVIVEQFVVGKEYLVDGFAMDNEYTNLDLGIKEYFNVPNIFVSKMCMFSSAKDITDTVEKMVLDENKKLIESIGLKAGITHAEYLYSEAENKVYLVEVAARGGGVFLSSHITPAASGFNTNEALIDYIVEGKIRKPDYEKLKTRVSAWVCFSYPDGEIYDIDGIEEVRNISGVYEFITDDIFIGKKVKRVCDDSGKYGPILVVGDTRDECYKTINKVKNTLKIEVMTETGKKSLIW